LPAILLLHHAQTILGSDPPRAGARLDACQREIRLNVSYLYSTTGYLAGNRDWRETTLDAACA